MRADETFARFWAAYPRHAAKMRAYAAWCKLDPDDALIERILDALHWQRALWNEPRFIPHPATYLNQERWTDEPTILTPHSPSRFISLGGRK